MPAKIPKPPGKKLKFAQEVEVKLTGHVGRYPQDPRATSDNPNLERGDMRVFIAGNWYVWVVIDGIGAQLIPLEQVTIKKNA